MEDKINMNQDLVNIEEDLKPNNKDNFSEFNEKIFHYKANNKTV